MLEGALEDELGRYPKGAWLRNPPAARTRRSATRAASCTSRPATSEASPLGAGLGGRGCLRDAEGGQIIREAAVSASRRQEPWSSACSSVKGGSPGKVFGDKPLSAAACSQPSA